MKQLHIREPWADRAYSSRESVIEDLLNRIQVLEARVQELEKRDARPSEQRALPPDPIPVRKTKRIPVGV